MPAPAPACTISSWPWLAYSRTAIGVRPTRCSWTLISLGTPTRISPPKDCFGDMQSRKQTAGFLAVQAADQPLNCREIDASRPHSAVFVRLAQMPGLGAGKGLDAVGRQGQANARVAVAGPWQARAP